MSLTYSSCAASMPWVILSMKYRSTAGRLLLKSPFAMLTPSRPDPQRIHLVMVTMRFVDDFELIPRQVFLFLVIKRNRFNRLHRLVKFHRLPLKVNQWHVNAVRCEHLVRVCPYPFQSPKGPHVCFGLADSFPSRYQIPRILILLLGEPADRDHRVQSVFKRHVRSPLQTSRLSHIPRQKSGLGRSGSILSNFLSATEMPPA